MAGQWPQQHQQPLNMAYGARPYQQQYPPQQPQQPHAQYVPNQQQAGQPYVQPPPVQQQYHQQQYLQQQPPQYTQYQQSLATSGVTPQHYQQPYAPPQQPQTQQYEAGSQQQQANQQSFAAPVQAVPAAQSVVSNHNCCFNCGSPDHWAQSCPEPKKQMGAPANQSAMPAAKGKKFNAPVVTKYAVPPHVAQAQAMQQQAARQAWQGPGYVQPGCSQYPVQQQMPHGPTTSVSAPPVPNGQWPQNTQYTQYQQGPQIGPTPQQAGVYPQYPYVSASQSPTQYFGTHAPNQMSPLGQHGSPFQPHYPQQVQTPQTTQMPPHTSASPHSRTSSISQAHPMQHPYGQGIPPANAQQALASSNPPTQSQTPISVQQATKKSSTEPAEPEEDDLRKLDVPDIPSPEGGATVTLVGRPLPTNFVVADALAPFAPPALGDKGLCKSKYLDRADTNNEYKNIKETSEWNSHKKDPIFALISDDSKMVPLRELDAIYRPHLIENGLSQGFDHSRGSGNGKNYGARYGDEKDVMKRLEDALHRQRTKPEFHGDHGLPSRKRARSQLREDEFYGREPRNRFSKRDVAVDSRPAGLPPRPYPPPTPQESYDENCRHLESRSASPRRYDISPNQNASPPDSALDDQSHQAYQGYPGYHQPDVYKTRDRSLRREDKAYPYQFHPPPPPPPPPMRKPSWYDGPGGSPPSADLATRDPFEPDSDDNMLNGNPDTPEGNIADVPVVSPLKLRSERSYLSKRQGTRDDSSEEEDVPGRRQADDVTPKLKRRQPKVAAAYSRRW